ncbi:MULTISPECIES: S8 family serine peptidase [unclassified Xanthomonas]|uniref:S8 family peptidase n=1 Tax=unclassified Xanthomonas TaxID=2643310 RepID=UPI002B2268F3|nr:MULTISPECIES: S8 family serine peptidase [unclassified Xanthomonas]MEA9562871.1 S8 family serine peptidase [Xanthomonas sp. WHRI 8932A]MEA9633924.1 S8 family serine peptidase [Xanthomonas sp. WHRI 8812E]
MATGKPPRPRSTRAAPRPATATAKQPARPQQKRAPRSGAQAAAAARVQGKARTVIYIHGIGNKPPAEVLRCQWDKALFGRPMGERTRLAYWVNRERYPVAEPGNCDGRDVGPALNQSVQRALSTLGLVPGGQDLHVLADALANSEQERADLHRLLDELETASAPGSVQAKGPIDAINRVLLRLISAALLQDVHDLFFVPERAASMRDSLTQRLRAGGGPFVVVAHSQGSMIAYDVLRQLEAADCEVTLLLTVGSPLGLPQVRSMFKRWTGTRKLPFPACVQQWINVAETRDPIALDPDLTDDIANAKGRFENIAGARINSDWQHNPHSGSGYLSIPQVRAAVRQAVGMGFDQPVSNAVLIKDLSEQLEAHGPEHRHEVLIELDRRLAGNDPAGVRAVLVRHLREVAARSTGLEGDALDEAIELEDGLQRFVSARLTRFEIESLQNRYRALGFRRVWRDAGKRALIHISGNVLHADAARNAYRARGQQIGWAVLDTGIAASHPHFFVKGQRDTVVAQWDCTRRGAPKRLTRADGDAFARLDRHGHGTHIAGIIAGHCQATLPDAQGKPGPPLEFAGMAPDAQLYGFKVLDDAGDGRDSWMIKAVQQVAAINERAGELVIHGVNLSLGGYFDPESYGCGFTPLCNELRRLWRQGVLVVVAAGNEGLAWLMGKDGDAYPANMDLSISDPGNLEEAIVVGSVHKSSPHNYGVSYFSSRGPTADGRGKPDVVAPGEKIVSAYYDFDPKDPASLMVEMSGTSMAAPHVSGVLAGFLSARREFIGFPDRVKQLMLDTCTDLERDRYVQGRGVPNLMRMLGKT